MITGLAGASIWSEDLNNLLPFYRDILGLEVTVQTPGFDVLGGLGLGTHSEVRGRDADMEDPTDYGNLWIATLKDPEGNLVQLFQSSGVAR